MRSVICELGLLVAMVAGLPSCRDGDALSRDFQRRLNGDVGEAKIKAQVQDKDQFQLPAMSDPGAPLALSGSDPLVKYNGTLLFWDAERVTPEQIALIANSSRVSRLKKADFLDQAMATVPGLRAGVAQKTAEIAANDAAIVAARRDTDSARVRAAMREFVEDWFDERLTLAVSQGALDTESRDEVERQFDRYCEYKLWELATSPLILKRFKYRPTPLSLCEPYYARRGYFSESASPEVCQEKAAQGDWFDCIWQQGILKSTMLAQLSDHKPDALDCKVGGAARVRAIEGWLEPEADGTSLLRKLVAATTKFQNKRLAQLLIQDGYPSLRVLLIASSGRAFREQYPFVNRFANCPEAFALKGQRGIDPVADAVKLNAKDPQHAAMPVTLAELKNIGENLTPSRSQEALFPALAGREEQAALVLKLVVAPLTAYGERSASDLGEDLRASYDDYAMNELDTGLIPLPPSHPGVLAIEGRIDANNQAAAFQGLRQVEDRILRRHYAPLLLAREVLPGELEQAKFALAKAIAALGPMAEAVQDENVKGAIAVDSAGATTFFNTMRLELWTDAEKLFVALELAEAGLLRGCSDFQKVLDCPGLGDTAGPLHEIVFDANTGKLTLEAELADPSAVGFAFVPRDKEPEKFNEIPPDSLKGTLLRLEVFANRIGDHFEFITGKAFILDSEGKTLHEGTFSADTYPITRSQLEL